MTTLGDPIIEHYQKTYELTHEMWQERNQLFVLLLATIGIGALLTFRVPTVDSILVAVIGKLLGLQGDDLNALQTSFPFGIAQIILLLLVFYLMVNLYHRAVYVLRNYAYLAALEAEIRAHLALPPDSISFTRESTFYWGRFDWIMASVKWFYIVLLGVLLAIFLVARIWIDVQAGAHILLIGGELVIAIAIFVYFYGYATSSVRLENRQHKFPK